MGVAEGVAVADARIAVGVTRVGVTDRVGVVGTVDVGVAIGVIVVWAAATANVPVVAERLSDRGTPPQALMRPSAANQMRDGQTIHWRGNFVLYVYALIRHGR